MSMIQQEHFEKIGLQKLKIRRILPEFRENCRRSVNFPNIFRNILNFQITNGLQATSSNEELRERNEIENEIQ